jgi:hypothetical protein
VAVAIRRETLPSNDYIGQWQGMNAIALGWKLAANTFKAEERREDEAQLVYRRGMPRILTHFVEDLAFDQLISSVRQEPGFLQCVEFSARPEFVRRLGRR